MINPRNIEPYIMYIGYLHYNYIYSPIKKLWLRWKYRKMSGEVRRKYLK
jgi:hypothetical protein